MALDRLYIPTFQRVGLQHTFDCLPKKWQDIAVLVVHPDEKHKGYPTLKCPVQGTGMCAVRKWISEHADLTRYGVLDDDINWVYCSSEDEILFGEPKNRQMTDEDFDAMFAFHNESFDLGYTASGSAVNWSPPDREKDWTENTRITMQIFYDGTKLPIENLDWHYVEFCEDYYLMLQLLTTGHSSRISNRYQVSPVGGNYADGGYSFMRTVEGHNESMRKLQKAFPDFVTLREKVTKSGAWAGHTKLAATVRWKQAYKSSQK